MIICTYYVGTSMLLIYRKSLLPPPTLTKAAGRYEYEQEGMHGFMARLLVIICKKGVTDVYFTMIQLQLQYITIFIPISSCSEAFSTHFFQCGAQLTSSFGGRWVVWVYWNSCRTNDQSCVLTTRLCNSPLGYTTLQLGYATLCDYKYCLFLHLSY